MQRHCCRSGCRETEIEHLVSITCGRLNAGVHFCSPSRSRSHEREHHRYCSYRRNTFVPRAFPFIDSSHTLRASPTLTPLLSNCYQAGCCVHRTQQRRLLPPPNPICTRITVGSVTPSQKPTKHKRFAESQRSISTLCKCLCIIPLALTEIQTGRQRVSVEAISAHHICAFGQHIPHKPYRTYH